MEPVIRLGISTCLLGERVRYDGGHKLDQFLVHTLGRFVTWVPVCPEVEIGLPIPRESMRLVGDPESPRLIAPKSGIDYTDRMKAWAQERLEQLAAMDLCGFVFKKDSPSSGLFRVRVYDEHGMARRTGTGIFPREVMNRFPLLPLEEEGRLNDMALRENFIERVFAYYRWTELLKTDPTPGGLVRFHTAHKLTLMAHSPKHYTEMGRLVARAGTVPWDELSATYGQRFMEALALLGTRRKHSNVLQHLMGFLKKYLTDDDKQELLGLIEDYRQGLAPLIVPLTLIQHYVRKFPVPEWVHQQVYLNPYPKELMLRNHV
ncbi:MAG: YbgA family protein [Anaerolineae bacterium]